MKNILLIMFLVPIVAFGQKRADQLPTATPADTDNMILVRGGSFWQTTLANLKAYTATAGLDTLFLSNDTLTAYTTTDTFQVDLSGYATGSITIWTTGTRPGSPTNGQTGHNTDIDANEYWDSASWNPYGEVYEDVLDVSGVDTVSFRRLNKYGTVASPLTGDVVFDFSDLDKDGKVQRLIHNDTSAPSFPVTCYVSGVYYLNKVNVIQVRYIEAGLQLVHINTEE